MATVLHIENNPHNMLYMKRAVEARGHQLIWAESGARGVAVACTLAPDLILLNMDLPDMDGCEIARYLRDMPRASHIPIIAISSNTFGSSRRALAAGCSAYLLQPVGLRELWKHLEAAIR